MDPNSSTAQKPPLLCCVLDEASPPIPIERPHGRGRGAGAESEFRVESSGLGRHGLESSVWGLSLWWNVRVLED